LTSVPKSKKKSSKKYQLRIKKKRSSNWTQSQLSKCKAPILNLLKRRRLTSLNQVQLKKRLCILGLRWKKNQKLKSLNHNKKRNLKNRLKNRLKQYRKNQKKFHKNKNNSHPAMI